MGVEVALSGGERGVDMIVVWWVVVSIGGVSGWEKG